VRYTAAGKAALALAGALAVGGLAAGGLLYRKAVQEADRERRLAEDGISGEAEVALLWRPRGENAPCRITYRFTSDGRAHSRWVNIPCRAWRKLSVGDRIPVRYARSNPDLSRLVGIERARRTPLWLAPSVAAALLAAGALIPLSLARRRRLLEEGRVTAGRVTRLDEDSEGFEVHYEYAILSGAVRSGKFGPVKKEKAPELGGSLVVIYAPEEPRRHARYPLALVTVAKR
jgi:hypothetical protein